MPIDRHYILFVHGVYTRPRAEDPADANYLFGLIESKVKSASPGFDLRKVAFYWGNVNENDE